MLLFQFPAVFDPKVDQAGQGTRRRHRRGKPSRHRVRAMVTLLEQRSLLATATITTLNLSSSSLTYGQKEVFTATVVPLALNGPTPTGGVVSFMEGPLTLGTGTLESGTATLSTQRLSAGIDTVFAIYRGTSAFAGSASAAIISTVAGGGDPATRQGLYTTLSDPEAVAVDSSGDLFIADSNENVIKEVNGTTGAVTVVAGNGTAGYAGDDGEATDAELDFPEGLALDGKGDLFIADTYNNVVRELNLTTGIITTYAGNYADSQKTLNPKKTTPPTAPSSYSGDNGPATAAELYVPIGVAVDNSGNLFIADSYNNRIREVVESSTAAKALGVSAGDIVTVAGTGKAGFSPDGTKATEAKLSGPSGVAVDSNGNLFIADTYNNVIREVDATNGDITTIAGKHGSGGNGGQIPSGSGGQSGSSSSNQSGSSSRSGGGSGSNVGFTPGSVSATSAKLHFPQGIYVPSPGVIDFADTFNNEIREITLQNGMLNTIAGDHTYGDSGDGGLATSAELGEPFSMTLDAAGDIFIADTYNNAIREVAESNAAAKTLGVSIGDIVTVAGGDAAAYSSDPGPASASELDDPLSVAVDGSNNIYIADTSNNAVREVNAQTGVITTVAGGTQNQPMYNNGLSDPADVAMDSSGDLFIADTDNNEVDEVNLATGQETIVAGDGTAGYSGDGGQATKAELNLPEGLAVDGHGNLFIADSGNNVIREVNLKSGIITTLAGSSMMLPNSKIIIGIAGYKGDDGLAAVAELNDPIGLALDGTGDLFIADSGNNVIREIVPGTNGLQDGIITTYAGDYNNGLGGYGGDNGPATAAQLNDPQGIAIGPTGNLFIADSGNNRVREVNKKTGIITTVAGDGTAGSTGDTSNGVATSAELNDPIGVVVTGGGAIDIADSANNVIRQVTLTSNTITTIAGNGGSGDDGDGGPAADAQLSFPQGLVVDSAGDLFIADSENDVVREVKAGSSIITTVVGGDGGLLFSNPNGPATAATLANPDGIVVDSQGDIFIADSGFNVVQEVIESPSTATALKLAVGDIITIAGDGAQGNIGNNVLATDAALDDPVGLALDGSGDLFIADSGNNEIREVKPGTDGLLADGTIMTVAGDGDDGYSGNGGAATAAELSNPAGVAVDSTGDIYIADQHNNVIREVDAATNDIETIAGDGTSGFSGDSGPATAAGLSGPTGVALDGSDLFIADTGNNAIREVNLTAGNITTFAGSYNNGAGGYSGDGGTRNEALLNVPSAVAVDSSGNLYIADSENNVVREVTPGGVGQTVTVAKAPLTITAAYSPFKVYGDMLTFAGTEFTTSGLVKANGDTVTGVSLTSAGAAQSAAVGVYSIVPSGAGGQGLSNYIITYQNGTLYVTSALLKITVDNFSKTYGTVASLPGTGFSETGLVTANGDKLTSVTLTSTGAPATAAVGTYPIVPTDPVGTGLSNYTIEFIDGTLTVTPAPATVESITIQKVKTGKHKTTQDIVVQFSEAIAMGIAQDLDNYSLVTVPKSKKQKGKTVSLASASYSTSAFTVTLKTSKPLVLSPPLNLTIEAAGPHDPLGLPLASNVVAKLTKGGGTITSAVPLVEARGPSARVIDDLLSAGFRPRTRHSRS